MKKMIVLLGIFIFLSQALFPEIQYKLGQMKTRNGTLDITYVKDSNRDFIRLYSKEETSTITISIPGDLKNIRAFIDKYHEWYKIAADNKSNLNKTIGTLTGFRVDFKTNNNNYEIVFIESTTGTMVAAFNPAQIDTFRDIISDGKIDKILNEEKRKKEKEESLFR